MIIEFQPLNQTRCALGESPVYDDRRNALFYCDITACAIHCCDLESLETRSWMSPARSARSVLPKWVASSSPATSGGLDPADGSFVLLAEIEKDRTDTRLNDGKVGPDGAYSVGSMDNRGGAVLEPIGSLYRVEASGTVEKKIDGLIVSNGLAFAPDGRTMFHSDSRGKWIDRWDLDPATGAIANRKRIVDLDDATGPRRRRHRCRRVLLERWRLGGAPQPVLAGRKVWGSSPCQSPLRPCRVSVVRASIPSTSPASASVAPRNCSSATP